MITRYQAMNLKTGTILHHIMDTNRDGTPIRARVNGRCQTWKSNNNWRLPMKHGLYDTFQLTQANAAEWGVPEAQRVELPSHCPVCKSPFGDEDICGGQHPSDHGG